MLGFEWQFVLELFEGFGDIPRHGEMYLVLCVAPVKVYANVSVASPMGAERVIRFNHRFEVHCMLFANVFDSKSSTTTVNQIGHQSCIHRPGTSLLCL